MTTKLIACAGLAILCAGAADAAEYFYTFTDGTYTGTGFLTATDNGGGLFTVTGGFFDPTYNNGQSVWDIVSGAGADFDSKLVIQNGQGYLDGLGLKFSNLVSTPNPIIDIWDGTQGSNVVPVAGETYSYNDTDNQTSGDGKGNLVLRAVPEPAPIAALLCALGLLTRRKRG